MRITKYELDPQLIQDKFYRECESCENVVFDTSNDRSLLWLDFVRSDEVIE